MWSVICAETINIGEFLNYAKILTDSQYGRFQAWKFCIMPLICIDAFDGIFKVSFEKKWTGN